MSKLAPKQIRRPRRFFAVGLVALLAGCSSVPDAVNPVEWYKGARDFVFGSDDQPRAPENARNEPTAERGQAAPGADQPIPNLNTVPARPGTSSREQRAQSQRGLVSDREGAQRYSREAVRRQGDPVNPLQTSPQVAARPATPRIVTPPRVATPSPPARPRPPVAAAPAPRPAPAPAPRQAAPTPPPAASTPAPAPQAAPAASSPQAPPTPRATPQLRTVAPAPSGGEFETIVISSAGVQTGGGASINPPASSPRISRPAPPPDAASTVGGVRSLSDFSSAAVQGSYQVATILFGNGSARLNAGDRRIVRQVFAQQRRTGGTIRIVGHASRRTANMDLVRHKLVNLRVSAARADAVARELIKLGARPGSLFVGAVSSRYPRYHEYMPSGEAGNRRAEIFIDF